MDAPYYSMFSDRGNAAVHEIVEIAREQGLKWGDIDLMLYRLSQYRMYSEAHDTAVRDAVWFALPMSGEEIEQ